MIPKKYLLLIPSQHISLDPYSFFFLVGNFYPMVRKFDNNRFVEQEENFDTKNIFLNPTHEGILSKNQRQISFISYIFRHKAFSIHV